jgi:hypothetical protein
MLHLLQVLWLRITVSPKKCRFGRCSYGPHYGHGIVWWTIKWHGKVIYKAMAKLWPLMSWENHQEILLSPSLSVDSWHGNCQQKKHHKTVPIITNRMGFNWPYFMVNHAFTCLQEFKRFFFGWLPTILMIWVESIRRWMVANPQFPTLNCASGHSVDKHLISHG